jgi:putative copper export protein
MIRKNITLSSVSELRRPRTYILGGIIVATGIIDAYIIHTGQRSDTYTMRQLIYDVIPLLIPLLAIPFLKQKKLTAPNDTSKKTTPKAVTIIGWIVILGFVGVLVYALLGNS